MSGSSKKSTNIWHSIRSGALAGIGSSFVFMIIHDIYISDIWFSWPIMILSGIACGVSVSWSYVMLSKQIKLKAWINYNLLFVAMFIVLGVISIIIYEPMTTVAALIAANEPPTELILEAMPMTIIFTILMSILIVILYGSSWNKFGIVLLTCMILVALLGLNVSTIGLVSIPGSSIHLIIELFGLIMVLNVFYVIFYILLEKKKLLHGKKFTSQSEF